MPVDTIGCGTYEYLDEVLEDVADLMSASDAWALEIRSSLGIPPHDSTTVATVLTDSSACEPLVAYFRTNMSAMYGDTAQLNAYGWRHFVLEFGSYRMLYVMGNDPPEIALGYRGMLYVFEEPAYLGAVMM